MIKKRSVVSRSAFCRNVFYLMCCASAILFSSDYDSKLPIVLFVGQHFSGSLFEWVHLSI